MKKIIFAFIVEMLLLTELFTVRADNYDITRYKGEAQIRELVTQLYDISKEIIILERNLYTKKPYNADKDNQINQRIKLIDALKNGKKLKEEELKKMLNNDCSKVEREAENKIVTKKKKVQKKMKQEKFIWPLQGYYELSSEYGWRKNPFGEQDEFHSGIDIPAPEGTKVHASAAGTVEWSAWSDTAGNWIGINNENGIYTVYMHMSKLLVNDNEKVSQGQIIGLVGTTGSSNGNHLHFAVKKNGLYVDPFDYVNK